MPKRILIP